MRAEIVERGEPLDIHIVSDATGETLGGVLRAAVAQFALARVTFHHWTLIRTCAALDRVQRGLEATGGIVFASLMDDTLRLDLETRCRALKIPVLAPLDPVITALEEAMGMKAVCRTASQYVLDDAYFRRIAAMDYVLAHDDGQAVGGLNGADIVLVGLSRTSKTPTAFYLANRGLRVANIPLIREAPIAPELLEARVPVIALTIDPRRLVEIRRHRFLADTGEGDASGLARSSPYIDYDCVTAETQWMRRLCRERNWPTIDVTHRSIEETAAAVLSRAEEWREAQASSSRDV